MIELTKKYRLIWDVNTKELLSDPYLEYELSTVTVSNSLGFYDCDTIIEVNNIIDIENLWYNS